MRLGFYFHNTELKGWVCVAYKIADLRHRITLQKLTRAPDGQGGSIVSWTDIQSVWAKITPTSAQEKLFAAKLQDEYDHEIIIRNTLDYQINKAADRFIFGTRIFQIKSVQYVDERKWWVKIKVKEGVAT